MSAILVQLSGGLRGRVAISLLVSALLVAAFFAKVLLLPSTLSRYDERLIYWLGMVANVVALACSVSMIWSNFAWRLLIAVFLSFAAFTCYRLLTGATSCGCAGGLAIKPWLSLIVESVVISALVFTYPAGPRTPARSLVV